MTTLLETFAAKAATSQTGYVHDSETVFWTRARRNRLLAQWACDLTDNDTQTYLRLLLDADFARVESKAAEGFLLLKIRNDLMGFGVFLTARQIREVCAEFEQQALLER